MKTLTFAAAALGTMLMLSPLMAQQPATGQRGQTMPKMSGMMDTNQMMTDMKADDARLQMLTEKMKMATGDQRMSATQDVVNELVSNQLKMHQHMMMMMQMHDSMKTMPNK